MYTAHYDLKMKPFQISSDATFMWLGEKHKEALATLRYGILDNKGFLLLTGDVGTGKTTLINTLIASLSNDVIYASIPDPSLEKMDFFNHIATAFDIGGEFTSKGKFLSGFTHFLQNTYERGQKVLLIIDESQLLTQELLEETRLLSNIVTKDSNPLLNIFFVGQYEFNELIRRPENRAIAQRLTLNYYIEPLTFEETGEYIRHRLKIAGTTKKIFNTSAIREIYAFSHGFPRRINIICDHSLMSGYAEDLKMITGSIVLESSKDLQIPEKRREQPQEKNKTVQHSEAAVMSGTSGTVTEQPGQTIAPSRPARSSQQRETVKSTLVRPVGSFLLIILVLMSCYFLFPDFINEKYRDTVHYLTSFQEKFGLKVHESSKKIIHQEQDKGKLLNSQTETKSPTAVDLPTIAKANDIPQEKKQQKQVSGKVSEPETVSEKLNKSTETPAPDKINVEPLVFELNQVLPAATEEQFAKPIPPGPVAAAPVILTESMSKDASAKNSEIKILPLPKENLVLRFKYDSNLFSVSDIERMKDFARILKTHPEAIVNVSGYTDSTGDEGYNRRLSQFRANMVKSFLMGQNLPPEQIRAQGFGSQNPVDSNDTAEGRTRNRRVELSIVAKD